MPLSHPGQSRNVRNAAQDDGAPLDNFVGFINFARTEKAGLEGSGVLQGFCYLNYNSLNFRFNLSFTTPVGLMFQF